MLDMCRSEDALSYPSYDGILSSLFSSKAQVACCKAVFVFFDVCENSWKIKIYSIPHMSLWRMIVSNRCSQNPKLVSMLNCREHSSCCSEKKKFKSDLCFQKNPATIFFSLDLVHVWSTTSWVCIFLKNGIASWRRIKSNSIHMCKTSNGFSEAVW